MAVRMEVFSGDPPCSGCIAVLALANEYAKCEDVFRRLLWNRSKLICLY